MLMLYKQVRLPHFSLSAFRQPIDRPKPCSMQAAARSHRLAQALRDERHQLQIHHAFERRLFW